MNLKLLSAQEKRFRSSLICIFAVGFVLFFWWTQSLYGFNPTDDGFILAQSWRLVQGELPHIDFTSPRPLGSAFLHAPFVISDWNMLAISRLFVTIQLFWIARNCVVLCTPMGKEKNQYMVLVGTLIAFVLNVGVWPIMAWHTVDGLFIGSIALSKFRRLYISNNENASSWFFVFLLAGVTPLFKQGFATVPLAIFAFLIIAKSWNLLLRSLWMAIPGVAYFLAFNHVEGGLLKQLYTGSETEAFGPFRLFLSAVSEGQFGMFTILFACVLVFLRFFNVHLFVVFAMALSVAPLALAFENKLEMNSLWAYMALGVFCLLTLLTTTDQDSLLVLLATGSLALASAYSWGVPNPGLLGGSLIIGSLTRVYFFYRSRVSVQSWKISGTRVVAFLVMVLCLVLTTQTRSQNVYGDLPKTQLGSSTKITQFGLVRMNLGMKAYLESLKACTEKYPARWTAVLPDGPGLYPLLSLGNPFSSDWWFPPEASWDKSTRDLKTIKNLNNSVDWLVLVQSYSAGLIPELNNFSANIPDEKYFRTVEDRDSISYLNGDPVTCGSFTGFYRPR